MKNFYTEKLDLITKEIFLATLKPSILRGRGGVLKMVLERNEIFSLIDFKLPHTEEKAQAETTLE